MSTSPNFTDDTNRWKTENVLNLANHFHKLNPSTGQHERVRQFVLLDTVEGFEDLATFQNQIKLGGIHAVHMYMALSAEPNQVNFKAYMILKVEDNTSVIHHYFMGPTEDPPCNEASPALALVPKIFKDMIAQNWDQMDFHLVDDLFVANANGQMVRVHYFQIGEDMISHINNYLLQPENVGDPNNELEAVTIYPGVDLNKFPDKTTISFTPVLGFRMKDPITKQLGFFGIAGCGGKEVYMEYSLPYPPTPES